jgi:Flp pilus assembly protein TadG
MTTRPDPSVANARDEGGIITGWLVKLVVILAVFGVVLFDAIGCGTVRMRTQDAAQQAARTAAIKNNTNVAVATQAATQYLATDYPEYQLVANSVVLAADGTVTLQVHGHADSIVLKHLGPLADWAQATATATVHPLP